METGILLMRLNVSFNILLSNPTYTENFHFARSGR